MKDYPAYGKELISYMKKLRMEIPETMKAFSDISKNSTKPGVLSTREKELVALGIAISQRCEGCIALHTHAALKAGASKEDIMETLGVCILMGGGPSMIYACEAIAALEQYEEKLAPQTV